ncbi:MAG: ABC transporter permease subunit [Treponema sp.]|jgi:ABC-type polysaccharide transport system permease subunit|nr:ABC transporter permease subunit [Treponema sp.]
MNTRKKWKISRERLGLTLLALPFVAFIIAFNYVPLHGWLYSFYDFKLGIPLFRNKFVGLDNFKFFIQDWRTILHYLKNNLIFQGLGMLTSIVPVILAILLSEVRSKGFKKLVQTTTTLPNFISMIIVFSMVFSIFSVDGLLNKVLAALGLIKGEPSSVLMNGPFIYVFITLIGIWKGAGWGAIVYLAGIAGIDSELYDAASVDGAGRFRLIWHITIPGILPTYVVLFLLSLGNLLSGSVEIPLIFMNSFVREQITTLDYYVYATALIGSDYSYAVAVSVFKSAISIVLLFGSNALARKVRGSNII